MVSASSRSISDAVVQNHGAFWLHHPGNEKYDFRLKDWTWDTRDGIATAAAYLGTKYRTTPRDLYREHLAELQAIAESITGKSVVDVTEERGE